MRIQSFAFFRFPVWCLGVFIVVVVVVVASSAQAVTWHPQMTDKQAIALAEATPPVAATCRVRGLWRPPEGEAIHVTMGTGVLIAPRWVATAKHVMAGRSPRHMQVRFGEQSMSITQVITHPEADLALLQLDAVPRDVEPVGVYRWDDEVGRMFTKVGYGLRGEMGPADSLTSSGEQPRANTNVYDAAVGHELHFTYQGSPPAPDATAHEGGTAPGDSGGPAYVEREGVWYVASLTQGPDNGFFIEARLSALHTWIVEQQQQHQAPESAEPAKSAEPVASD